MRKIKLFVPYVSWLARLYVMITLFGTQLAEGPVVKQFEKEFALKFKKKNPVSLNSGTSALELAFELAGVGEGDEVITPVLTCTATNLPIVRRGAKIVFADIDPDSLNVSVKDVEGKITKRTKALVFVHFGGYSVGIRAMRELADKYKIPLIEDAAQSVGNHPSLWGLGDYVCVSTQAIKTLTSGDGGFLICKSDEDTKKARMLRWFGYDREAKQRLGDTDLELAGYKYHMNDVSASLGLGNLRALDSLLKRREKVRQWYREAMHEYGISSKVIKLRPWLAILVHPNAQSAEPYLKSWDIGCGPYHFRNDQYSIFGGRLKEGRVWVGADPIPLSVQEVRDIQSGDIISVIPSATIEPIPTLPNMDAMEHSYTLLPFHHKLTRSDVYFIVEKVSVAIRRKVTDADIRAAIDQIKASKSWMPSPETENDPRFAGYIPKSFRV